MLTLESQRQYAALGVNTTCGGIEVARTEARVEELRRRMTSARAWGIEAELLTSARGRREGAVRQRRRDPGRLLHAERVGGRLGPRGGPSCGSGRRRGACSPCWTTPRSPGWWCRVRRRSARPRIRAVVTAAGEIEVEQVVIACGVWSPRLAAMAGATIPLTPAVHQMADLGPVDLLLKTGNEIGYPIVRDMDTFMYERQSHDAMEVGSYAHCPILVHPDDIPSLAEAERTPTEMPFTAADFAPQLEHAREIMGELLAGSEMQYAVNGLLSLTPDTHQLLGEDRRGGEALVGGCSLGQGGAPAPRA